MLSQVLWNAPRALPVAVAAGLLLLAAVAWLYPPQVRELRGPWRGGLPAPRAGAVAALAAAAPEPAGLRAQNPDQPGALVGVGDKARGMAVTAKAPRPAPRR